MLLRQVAGCKKVRAGFTAGYNSRHEEPPHSRWLNAAFALVLIATCGLSLSATAADKPSAERFGNNNARLAPDIGGLWQGPEWGIIVLRPTGPGRYEGQFTEVGILTPGTLSIAWSPDERLFVGEYQEGKLERGTLTFKPPQENTIEGEWTILEPKGVVDPPFGDLKWRRGGDLHLYGFTIGDEALDVVAGQRFDTLMITTSNISDQGLKRLAAAKACRKLVLQSAALMGPGLTHLKNAPGLEAIELPQGPTEDVLEYIAGLPDLRELSIRGMRLTPTGLDYLSRLTKLRQLDLCNCPLTDEGLKQLTNLSELTALNLANTEVGDAGLTYLKSFPHLTTLYLSRLPGNGNGITDHGVKVLAALTDLKILDLSRTAVGDEAMVQIATLKNLQTLRLVDTKVTAAGLKRLTDLPELNSLWLPHQVALDGLPHLQAMKELKLLQVYQTPNTKVSDPPGGNFPRHCRTAMCSSSLADSPAERFSLLNYALEESPADADRRAGAERAVVAGVGEVIAGRRKVVPLRGGGGPRPIRFEPRQPGSPAAAESAVDCRRFAANDRPQTSSASAPSPAASRRRSPTAD